jgi:hypothetical protein
MNENRPNIITIGAIGGAIAWFVCFGLKRYGIDLGAEGGIAMSTLVTAGMQIVDRWSKREDGYVINKYGPPR